MRGRYTRYSPEAAEAILARLKGGESLDAIGQDRSMPAECTIRRWARARPDFGAALAAARDPAHRRNPGGFDRPGPGRTVGYSPELAQAVCDRLSEGLSMREVRGELDLPAPATLFGWMKRFPEFREMYEAACEARALLLREEALEIADDDSRDLRVGRGGALEPAREVLARDKLRIDVRLRKAVATQPKGGSRATPKDAAAGDEDEFCYEDLLDDLLKRDGGDAGG